MIGDVIVNDISFHRYQQKISDSSSSKLMSILPPGWIPFFKTRVLVRSTLFRWVWRRKSRVQSSNSVAAARAIRGEKRGDGIGIVEIARGWFYSPEVNRIVDFFTFYFFFSQFYSHINRGAHLLSVCVFLWGPGGQGGA